VSLRLIPMRAGARGAAGACEAERLHAVGCDRAPNRRSRRREPGDGRDAVPCRHADCMLIAAHSESDDASVLTLISL